MLNNVNPDAQKQTQQPPENSQKPQGEGNPEQDYYDIFVAQGIKVVSQVAKKMQGKSSIDVLGNTLFEIVKKIETGGVENGIRFPLSVLLHGSNEILGHLIGASAVKINEDQIKAVVGTAVGKYIQDAIKTGKMTPEQVSQLAQQAQQNQPKQQPQQQPANTPARPVQPQIPAQRPVGNQPMGGQNGRPV